MKSSRDRTCGDNSTHLSNFSKTIMRIIKIIDVINLAYAYATPEYRAQTEFADNNNTYYDVWLIPVVTTCITSHVVVAVTSNKPNGYILLFRSVECRLLTITNSHASRICAHIRYTG